MSNILKIFKRDVMRLLRAPAALVVVAALVVLPSLYTWFNVVGFWNPYENTGNLRVCVVNEDTGTETDVTGRLDVGDLIVEQLESNTQLGWTLTDRESAMAEVRAGTAYAAFVVPENFSANIATLLTGDFTQPQIEYYVNEKSGPVSTKITDTGATTLDQTINSTFVSTVSSVVADAVDKGLGLHDENAANARNSVSGQFAKAQAALANARETVAGLQSSAASAAAKTTEAQGSLDAAKRDIAALSDQLARVSQLAASAQTSMGPLITSLMGSMDVGSLLISQAAAGTNAAIGTAAGAVAGAQAGVDAAVKNGQAALNQAAIVIDELESLGQTLPDSNPNKQLIASAADALRAQNESLSQALAGLAQTSGSTASIAAAIAEASDKANTATQGSLSAADTFRNTLSTSTFPAVSSGIAQLGAVAGGLSGTVAQQTALVDQTSAVLNQLAATLATTADALGQTDALLASLQSSLDTAQTDLVALGSSSALDELLGKDGIDAAKVADFMLSPTQLRTESLYPLNAYGSAMAPLFTNLTLWIGAFMLLVILRQEVDGEGIPNLTLSQRYLGRGLLLAVLASLQAIVCCTGNLIIGVQTVSVALYYLTAVAASLTYLSIQYALSVVLQHVGKGLCVLLVFMQIPGATGLYPIEMTPAFFQAVYPFFPFTYGIGAMRETISGFYGGNWGGYLGILLVFLVAFLAFGLAARPYLTNLNRLFAKQIAQSDILNGEQVEAPARRYRLAQLIRALSDRNEYQASLRERARQFLAWYPRLKRSAWAIGVVVPVAAAVVLSLTEGEKVILLTLWLAWLVASILVLVVLEYVHDSFERQLDLESLSDDELRGLFDERNSLSGAACAPGACVPSAAPVGAPGAAATSAPCAPSACTAETAPAQRPSPSAPSDAPTGAPASTPTDAKRKEARE